MRLLGLASLFLLVLGCSSSPGTSTSPDGAEASPDGGAAATDAGADAAPPPCSGQPGTFHDQAFAVDGETRHYWLHVPAATASSPVG